MVFWWLVAIDRHLGGNSVEKIKRTYILWLMRHFGIQTDTFKNTSANYLKFILFPNCCCLFLYLWFFYFSLFNY